VIGGPFGRNSAEIRKGGLSSNSNRDLDPDERIGVHPKRNRDRRAVSGRSSLSGTADDIVAAFFYPVFWGVRRA
jgi:hypothetical protein